MTMTLGEPRDCGDCGAKPGELHADGCDVERCAACGRQRISCYCGSRTSRRLPWTGHWPGDAECIEFGWACKRNPRGPGWIECSPDDPEATPDLNRLAMEGVWDSKAGRFVKPGEAKAPRRTEGKRQ